MARCTRGPPLTGRFTNCRYRRRVAEQLPSILSLPASELESWLSANDMPVYRRKQIWAWLARGAPSFEAMQDLPKQLRSALDRDFRFTSLRQVAVSEADRTLTTKALYELDGGHSVEAVVMRYADRSTLCISSQAGCPIGCPFCATGKFPFGRNLQAHEIVEQAVDAARLLASEGKRLSHIVFMGMGEPMANYQAVVQSVRRFADPELLGISPRRIVVSTSGLIPRITQLGGEQLPVTLAISLHAARNELRDVLVPINRKYPVEDLVESAQGYANKTGRRVSYEWVLLAGVNDTERDAKELGRLLRRKLAHVNLIPFNPVEDTPYRAPDRASIRRFKELVEAQGLNVTVRDTRGREADAACGQLHERVMRSRPKVGQSQLKPPSLTLPPMGGGEIAS
jgi:23S rRNA (adenine2503-C2)-methyltransferase